MGTNVTCGHNDCNMIKTINTQMHRSLIKWLKDNRLKQGLTTRQLGKLLDEPFQFVSKVESSERKLTVHEYIQYCKALKLDHHFGLKFFED